MTNAFGQLAEFAAAVRLESVPAEVLAQARRVVLDTAGAIVAGSVETEIQALAAGVADPVGRATVLGTRYRAEPHLAAFVNGTAGDWQELDEGHRFTRGHPGIHVVPAALAVGEASHASGAAVLQAILAGYEVAARAGIASRLRPEIHPHGTWGVLGATTAAGLLRGLTVPELERALTIAGSLMIAGPFGAALTGATVRNAYCGLANQHGMLAASLAGAGVTGYPAAAEEVLGRVLGYGWDEAALLDRLGERWEIGRNYFKPYAACRLTHGPLELIDHLRTEHDLQPEQIRSIQVGTHQAAVTMAAPSVEAPLAARFSTPTMLALVLLGHGERYGLRFINEAAVTDPAVRDLAGRVTLVLDPEAEARYPAERRTRLTVALTNGRVLTADSRAAFGDNDLETPMTDDDLEHKFRELVGPVLSGAVQPSAFSLQPSTAFDAWRALDRCPIVGEAIALLTPGAVS